MASITGILLAAGSSRRFGSDKLSHRLPDGDLVAARACRNLLEGVGNVLAVVRPGADHLSAALRSAGAEISICADARQGMGASLAFAVQCAMSSAGWIVALADMPWIAASTSRRIAESLQAGAPIAAPRWQGRQGHPVGFSGLYRDELIRLGGDRGAKALLRQHHRELRLVDCDDPGILLDIDEPADLLRRLHHASDVD